MIEFPKWIIKNDQFILGRVEMHLDLTNDKSGIKGGGWWHFDKDNGILYLYRNSIDFGSCTIEQVRDIKENGLVQPSIQNLKWIFSNEENFIDAVKNGEEV